MTSVDEEVGANVAVAPQLSSIYLYECSVVRGSGDADRPGEVLWNQGVQTGVDSALVRYLISSTAELRDADGASIAEITFAFVAAYTRDGDMSEDDVNRFAPSVVMHVTPYQRELLASLTTRMSVPTFVLPLLRLGEFQLDVSSEEHSGVEK